jgi:hypothetical protein
LKLIFCDLFRGHELLSDHCLVFHYQSHKKFEKYMIIKFVPTTKTGYNILFSVE